MNAEFITDNVSLNERCNEANNTTAIVINDMVVLVEAAGTDYVELLLLKVLHITVVMNQTCIKIFGYYVAIKKEIL